MANNDSSFHVLLAWSWKVIRLPLFVYIGLIVLLSLFENRLVFQPSVESGKPPNSLQPNVRHQFIRSNDHKLHLLIVERTRPNCYAL